MTCSVTVAPAPSTPLEGLTFRLPVWYAIDSALVTRIRINRDHAGVFGMTVFQRGRLPISIAGHFEALVEKVGAERPVWEARCGVCHQSHLGPYDRIDSCSASLA